MTDGKHKFMHLECTKHKFMHLECTAPDGQNVTGANMRVFGHGKKVQQILSGTKYLGISHVACI